MSEKTPAEIAAEKRLAHRLYCIAHGYQDSDVDWIGTQLEDGLLKCINEAFAEERKRFDAMAAFIVADKIDMFGTSRLKYGIEGSKGYLLPDITEAAKRHEAQKEDK